MMRQDVATLVYIFCQSCFNRSALKGCCILTSHRRAEVSSYMTDSSSKSECHGRIKIYERGFFIVFSNGWDKVTLMGSRPVAWMKWTWVAAVPVRVRAILTRWTIHGKTIPGLTNWMRDRWDGVRCISRTGMTHWWPYYMFGDDLRPNDGSWRGVWYGKMLSGKQLWNAEGWPTDRIQLGDHLGKQAPESILCKFSVQDGKMETKYSKKRISDILWPGGTTRGCPLKPPSCIIHAYPRLDGRKKDVVTWSPLPVPILQEWWCSALGNINEFGPILLPNK